MQHEKALLSVNVSLSVLELCCPSVERDDILVVEGRCCEERSRLFLWRASMMDQTFTAVHRSA